MSKHTPGPWKVSHGCLPGDSGFSVATANAAASGNVKITAECWPCTIVSEDHRSELFANAFLIAAAPDLLEACRAMLTCCGSSENWNGETHEALKLIEAAIAKAEGR